MASEIDAHLGQRLRRRRWMLGLTQSQLGDRVGIKFQQVQKYETGQNRISASRLWDLANAVEAPISYFYDGLSGPAAMADADADGQADAPSEAEADAEPAARPAPAVEENGELRGDLLNDREAIDLVRSYYLIPESPRRRLFDLVKALGDSNANGAGTDKDKAEKDKAEKGWRREAG